MLSPFIMEAKQFLVVFQLTFSKLTVLKMMLSDTSRHRALTQAAVAAKSLTSLLSPSASI